MRFNFKLLVFFFAVSIMLSFKSVDEDVGKNEPVKMEQVLNGYEVLISQGWEMKDFQIVENKKNSPFAIAIFAKEQCEMVCYSNTITDFDSYLRQIKTTRVENPLKQHLSIFYTYKYTPEKEINGSSGGKPSKTT